MRRFVEGLDRHGACWNLIVGTSMVTVRETGTLSGRLQR